MNELDRYAVSLENMEVLRAQVEALEAWKAEELALMNPLMDYARSVCTGPLDCSITEWLVEDHKRLAALSANHSEQVRHMVPDGWTVERGCSPSGYVLHSPGGSMIRVCDSGMGGIETAFAMFLKAMLAAAPSAGSQKEQGE